LPTTKIDQSKLYRPDPLEDIRRREAEAQTKLRENEVARIQQDNDLSDLQADKLEAEIAVIRSKADDDELDLGDVRSTLNVIDRQLSNVIINKSNANLSWSENTGYQTTQTATEKETQALENAKEINSEVLDLVRKGMDLDKAITHATKYIIPKYYPSSPPPPRSDGTEKTKQSRTPNSLKDVPESDIALVDEFLATEINRPENMVKGVFFSSLKAHLENKGVPSSTARRIANAYTEISY
jgi:hypothetical protein